MKLITILAFGFVVIVAATTTAYAQQQHNVTWGVRGYYDLLLYKDYIIEPKKLMRKVTRDVTFPPKGLQNYRTITQVKVTDLIKNGTGGYATLYGGGPNYRNVSIHFKSQRGYGMSFLLEIYGQ